MPLDQARLQPFRQSKESEQDGIAAVFGNGSSNGHEFMALYSSEDDATGIEWHLWVRDLVKRSEWDRWKIVEAQQMSKVS